MQRANSVAAPGDEVLVSHSADESSQGPRLNNHDQGALASLSSRLVGGVEAPATRWARDSCPSSPRLGATRSLCRTQLKDLVTTTTAAGHSGGSSAGRVRRRGGAASKPSQQARKAAKRQKQKSEAVKD